MQTTTFASVLALLVALAVPGFYALPAAPTVDVGPQLETALDAALELTDGNLPQEGLARRAISSGNCVDYIYIMAQTSGWTDAGTDSGHKVEIAANGQTRSIDLPNRLGDDYQLHKGDLWKLSLSDNFGFSSCITKCDIQSVAIVEGSNGGWNIESIITILRDDADSLEYYEVATMDMDVYRWIDGDSGQDQERKRFDLSLLICQ